MKSIEPTMSYGVERMRRKFVSAAVWLLAAVGCLLGAGETPAAAQPAAIRIAFVGDSMIDGIWGGLVRLMGSDSCLKGKFVLGRYGNNGTGLSRLDKYNWPAEVQRIMTTFQPDMLVVSLGLNDRQPLVDRNHVHTDYGTPEWAQKYTDHATQLLQNAANAKAGVLWVGIPVMRDAVANNDATEKDRLFAEAVSKLSRSNIKYVEPWRLNPSGPEVYKSIGPGRSGSVVTLRAPDGIHFTSAGYDVIASYIFPKIVGNLQEASIAVPQPCGR